MEIGGNNINFLDLNISIIDNKLSFNIFRKPTFSDNIIHATSQHHSSHKFSVFHSLLHRLLHVPLSVDNFEKELKTIKLLAKNNDYDPHIIDKMLNRKNRKIYLKHLTPGLLTCQKSNNKWAKIPYINGLSNKISKILKKNNKNVAYYSRKSLKSYLVQNKDKIDKINQSGVYKLNCNDCESHYIGQTGRSFKIRLKEHLACYRNKNDKSNFALHLNEQNHSFNNTTGISFLHLSEKSKKLNKLEALEINRLKYNNNINLLNDQQDIDFSPLLKPLQH
jgi:hypothetical protein